MVNVRMFHTEDEPLKAPAVRLKYEIDEREPKEI